MAAREFVDQLDALIVRRIRWSLQLERNRTDIAAELREGCQEIKHMLTSYLLAADLPKPRRILCDEDFDQLYYILGAYVGAARRNQLPADEIVAIEQLTKGLKDKLTELQCSYDHTNSSKTTDSRRQ